MADPSRQTQRRHLKALGSKALQQYCVGDARLSFVSDTANTIFRVDTSEQRYVLRIHPPGVKTTAAINEEIAWLAALRQDTALNVPKPVALPDGAFVQEISVPSIAEPHQVVLFGWMPGRHLGDNVALPMITQVGQLMAQLHQHASTWGDARSSTRDTINWRGMGASVFDIPAPNLVRLKAFLTEDQRTVCERAAQLTANVISDIDTNQNYGLIHSDIHFANCLSDHGQLHLLDFDDCQYAPFTYDIAITLSYLDERADYDAARAALIGGYCSVRALPHHSDTNIEAFMVERGLRLVRWVASWPHVDHFPFGSYLISTALKRCRRYLEQQE